MLWELGLGKNSKAMSSILRLPALIGLVFLLFFPWSVFKDSSINLSNISLAPSLAHPFGTDHLGRDILVLLSDAVLSTVPVLWAVVSIAVVTGWCLGLLLTIIPQRLSRFSFLRRIDIPISTVAGAPLFLMVFVFAISFKVMGLLPISISLFIMFLLSSVLQVRTLYAESSQLSYWKAYISLGGTDKNRMLLYGIGGIWKIPMIMHLCHSLSLAIVTEVSLSYLGFGIQEPRPSLGNILSAHFTDYLHGDFRVLTVTLIVMSSLVILPKLLAHQYFRFTSSKV